MTIDHDRFSAAEARRLGWDFLTMARAEKAARAEAARLAEAAERE